MEDHVPEDWIPEPRLMSKIVDLNYENVSTQVSLSFDWPPKTSMHPHGDRDRFMIVGRFRIVGRD